ncbi:radical SAM family heme chaperone HemW [Trichloromonas sp.]|uniref:radical SAM family heme chaperone HemW n=1 Tax=Trichloromonas sp. TaxID=3069249 RepID=UPI003D819896
MTSLYLHIPFCQRKCPYCDFYSTDRHTPADLDNYTGQLLRHLELAADSDSWPGPLETVFFGGGTPSLLTPAQVGRVLQRAETLFGLAAACEISLEANPGTVSLESLRGYHSAGVNRLSLGVQSLNARSLQRLGRIHAPEDAVKAIRLSRQAGFDNLSCDLMFALPGQSLANLMEELARLLEHHPEHLSCYGLSVEEDTPYHAQQAGGLLQLPEETGYAGHFMALHHQLTAAGYDHYEISNYARPGRQCRHNLGYWRRQACLGIGAGAHSFDPRHWGFRRAVAGDLERYRLQLQQGLDPATELEQFDRRGAMAETLYLGLRTAEGVGEAAFAARFGESLGEVFAAALNQASGHLVRRHGHWRLTPEGWLIFDHLILPFL